MQQFGEPLGAFQGQSLQDVGVEELPLFHPLRRQLPYAGADGGYEESGVVHSLQPGPAAARPGRCGNRADIIRQTQPVALRLPPEVETFQRLRTVGGIHQQPLPVGTAGEKAEHGVGGDVGAGQHQILYPAHGVPQLYRRRLAGRQRLGKPPLIAQMPHIEHLRVDVGEDGAQIVVGEGVQAQVGRGRRREIVAHLGRGYRGGVPGGGPAGIVPQHRLRFGFQFGGQLLPFVGFLNGVGQRQPGHRVGGVGHQAGVFRGDAQAGKAVGQGGAAHQHRHADALLPEIAHRFHHHLRRFHQQARQADDVGLMLPRRCDEFLGRHLDAQIDDPVAVVGKDDFHQILADVVHIALDGRQHHPAFDGAFHPLHMRLQVGDGELHRLGGLQHFGNDELVGVELPPHFGHAVHQRAVDDFQRRPFPQRLIQIVGQPLFAALDDGQRQPFIQRQILAFFVGGGRRLVAEMGGKGGHRVVAAIPDEVFRQLPLFLRNGGIAHHRFGVDDGHVEAGLDAVIQENRIQHFAPGGGQAKGDIGDSQNRLGLGQRLFDEPDALDGFGPGADIVGVAGADGKDQRVENQVFRRDAVFFGEQRGGTQGHFQLALAGDGLRLLRVVVDAAHHQRRPVAAGQRRHRLKAGLAILQIDRVDDGLALQPFQRQLNHGGVGGVDHYGRLDFAGDQFQELRHIRCLVAVGVLQADIQDMGAVAGLAAADFGGLFKGAVVNQAAEPAAAQHIGAFPDDGRAHLVVHQQRLDAGNAGFRRFHRAARRLAGGQLRQQPHVFVDGAAATPDDIHPAGLDEPPDGVRHRFRRFVVAAVFVGHSGVGDGGHRKAGQGGQTADMVGHELRPGGAVDANPQQFAVGQRGIERLHILPGQQRTHGLDGALHRHRRRAAQFGHGAVDALQPGLDVQRILAGFQQQHIGAALQQPRRLLMVGFGQFVESDAAGNGDGLGGRPHRAGHEPGPVGRAGGGGLPAGDDGGRAVEAAGFMGQPVFGQHHRRSAESVGFDDVGAGGQVAPVDFGDDFRAGDHQILVAAFVLGAAEIVGA